jgi:hypothetical protein
MTRGADTEEAAYTLPTGELRISIIEDSYASKRGWIPGEKLYQMADYTSQKMSVADYSDEYKQCIEQGKRFVIKDEDSVVFERKQVSKRVPVKSLLPDVSIPDRTCNVQLEVQNLEPYFDD